MDTVGFELVRGSDRGTRVDTVGFELVCGSDRSTRVDTVAETGGSHSSN